MAEDLPSELSPSAEPELVEDALAAAAKPHGRNRKLMYILAAAMLGGTILGVAGMAMVSSLFKDKPVAAPASPPPPVAHPIEVPTPDPKQEAAIKELREQNEKLEAQIKHQATLQPREAPSKSEEPSKSEARPAPPPPRIIYRTVKSDKKPKVAEDCTITEKDDGLGPRLKKCIEDFNSATH